MKREIENVVRQYCQAVRTQDEALFKGLWSKAGGTLISIGNAFYGTNDIYERFLIGGIQKAYETIVLINDGMEIKEVNENLAVVVFSYHTECVRRGTKEFYSIQGLETQVMVKEDGSWKLLHVHYSKI